SVPEQRYTEAGGGAMVQENAACVFDNTERAIEKHPTFAADEIEKVETAFMSEMPPRDGHPKNILTAWHKHLRIGLVKPLGVPVACVAQEFTDVYGSYASLPKKVPVGKVIEVAGEITRPATLGGVGLARIATPTPKRASELNGLRTYPVPVPYATYFPK